VGGLAVTVALLAWTLHDVDLRAALSHLRRADPVLLAAVMAIATLTFPLRTIRWRVILGERDGSALPWTPLWHATAVGFMANNVLPLRAGEVARAYAATRLLPLRLSTALASIGIERVLDGLVLVGLMGVAIAVPGFPARGASADLSLGGIATVVGALFGAALLMSALVVHRPAPWIAFFTRWAGRLLPTRLAGAATRTVEGLVQGLGVLRSPGRFAAVVGWSLVLWLVNAASFALCYRAFGVAAPLESALLLQGVIALGVAIPAAPGFWGVFEAATRVTLVAYGVDATAAVSYGVAYHASTFVPITLLGLYSLSRAGLRLGQLAAPPAAGARA
jgi:uncharacterized membrane protein YbhN (UPF0104 family)